MTDEPEGTAAPGTGPLPGTPYPPLRSIHEIGVHGSVIEQTYEFLKDEMKPDLGALIDKSTGESVPVVVTKSGYTIVPPEKFDAWRDNPRYRNGTATLLDLDSLIAHIQRFKDVDTLIFANNDRQSPTITAVLDYHKAGAEAEPRWGRHRSHFAFPLSDEWRAWMSRNGTASGAMKMADFARFLEDHIIDVLPPSDLHILNDEQNRFIETLGGARRIADPAKLMEVATGLQVFEDSEVSNAIKLQTGEGKFTFSARYSDQPGGGELSVPSMFVIGIPVFTNGPAYPIVTRLRFRKAGSDLVFFYEMWRTDRVFDHAFDEAISRVRDETELPVLLGFDEDEDRADFKEV